MRAWGGARGPRWGRGLGQEPACDWSLCGCLGCDWPARGRPERAAGPAPRGRGRTSRPPAAMMAPTAPGGRRWAMAPLPPHGAAPAPPARLAPPQPPRAGPRAAAASVTSACRRARARRVRPPAPCAALRGAGVTRRAACEAVPGDTGWQRARCGTAVPGTARALHPALPVRAVLLLVRGCKPRGDYLNRLIHS